MNMMVGEWGFLMHPLRGPTPPPGEVRNKREERSENRRGKCQEYTRSEGEGKRVRNREGERIYDGKKMSAV
jgi:hypothetical protein